MENVCQTTPVLILCRRRLLGLDTICLRRRTALLFCRAAGSCVASPSIVCDTASQFFKVVETYTEARQSETRPNHPREAQPHGLAIAREQSPQQNEAAKKSRRVRISRRRDLPSLVSSHGELWQWRAKITANAWGAVIAGESSYVGTARVEFVESKRTSSHCHCMRRAWTSDALHFVRRQICYLRPTPGSFKFQECFFCGVVRFSHATPGSRKHLENQWDTLTLHMIFITLTRYFRRLLTPSIQDVSDSFATKID